MFELFGFLIRSFWPLLVVLLLGNVFIPEKKFEALDEEAAFLARAGQYGRARNVYRELAERKPERLEYHRGYLTNHFRTPRKPTRYSSRDDTTPRRFYEELAAARGTSKADAGRYGLGFYYVQQDQFGAALDWYQKISNRDAPFINNSIGYVLRRLGRLDAAELHFRREIEVNGNKSGAWSNLAQLYDIRGDLAALERLLEDPEAGRAVSSELVRKTHYTRGDWGAYWEAALPLRHYSATGVIASSAIALMWFIWLTKLDLYEPEDRWHKLAVLAASFLLTETLALPAYDFYSFTLGLDLQGGALSDFVFSVVGIGVIEETIKIVPFLAVLYLSKSVNESVDYVVYASVSALGFALAENIGYLSPDGIENTVGRALTASVAHMALTTIAVSGFLENKYSPYIDRSSGGPRNIALGFGAACLLHGVYDFFLVTDGFWAELAILSLGVLYWKVKVFGKLIHSALNHSEFYDPKKGRQVTLREHLTRLVIVVFSLQFLLMGILYGRSTATWDLLGAVWFSWVIVLFLLGDLAVFQVRKGEWRDVYVDD